MGQHKTKIIACETVIQENRSLVPASSLCIIVESGLHLHPDKLRMALQQAVDDTPADVKRIILGFGLCSMAVVGLKSRHSTLIVPRVDDCIGIFLGSRKSYMDEMRKEPGTYFLSKGWIESGVTLVEEFEQMVDRYGRTRAEKVQRIMLRNYVRLAFIDMGHDNGTPYREFARRAAAQFNLRYEEIKGTNRLLKKVLRGPWDSDFIITPPGHEITHDDFGITGEAVVAPTQPNRRHPSARCEDALR